MGGGSWDTGSYRSASATRAATGKADFDYTCKASKVHDSLDPKRINNKPFGKLEARDSTEHPASTPVLVVFDVTGSNYDNARVAQKKLPNLMELLNKYATDPQVAIAANDDWLTSKSTALQISDFESDNRVDDHLRNVWLIAKGGGNDGESYDLALYAAARKVALDSVEKRGKLGYLFMYADEPVFDHVDRAQVEAIFGDKLERDLPIEEVIEEVRRNFRVFMVWPTDGYAHAREQYVRLFGEESVLTLQHPNLLCELIASTVGLYDGKATTANVVTDLVAVGVQQEQAQALVTQAHAANIQVAVSGGAKAARL